MPNKKNLFEEFEKNKGSDGLKTIEKTKITLTREQRTKRVSITVAPSEFIDMRDLSRKLEDETGIRAPISDLTRDLWLILLGKNDEKGPYSDRLKEMLKINIQN